MKYAVLMSTALLSSVCSDVMACSVAYAHILDVRTDFMFSVEGGGGSSWQDFHDIRSGESFQTFRSKRKQERRRN
jgi:hypothetical protein